ncbi:MAG: HAMP domain-containing histidine kinase [Algicola sp.]|nr:HAMP domain-containing histidine kinase [Algicola sp.]
MKSKFVLAALLLGLSLLFYSFYVTQRIETQMMSVYLSAQKENLAAGWNQQWQQTIVNHLNQTADVPGYRLIVDRRGQLLGPAFYPSQDKALADWSRFEQLSQDDKKQFLEQQLTEPDSWNRASAVKKWWQLYDKQPNGSLSPYEQTLIYPEAKMAYALMFSQLRERTDYTTVDEQYQLDKVLLKVTANGEVIVFLPHSDYLKQHLLPRFTVLNRLGNSTLQTNPLYLSLDDKALFSFGSSQELLFSFSGLLLVLSALGIYLFDLKTQKQQVDKKLSFLNQLVHEIKTPLTGMRLNLELLQKYGHDQELLDAVIQGGDRLHSFFADIVLINSPQGINNPVSLSAEQWADFLSVMAQEFDGAITIDNQVQQAVFVDIQRLGIVLRNLLKNAVRYGQRGHCTISCTQQTLSFMVIDEGTGVGKSDAEHIFDEFFRAADAKQLSPDGLGIGLSIVKKLVGQMGGDIRLTNPGQPKATFILTLEMADEQNHIDH